MSINYGSAYRAFRREQEKLREQYRQLGMTDEQIAAMYEFDLKEFTGRSIATTPPHWTKTSFRERSSQQSTRPCPDVPN